MSPFQWQATPDAAAGLHSPPLPSTLLVLPLPCIQLSPLVSPRLATGSLLYQSDSGDTRSCVCLQCLAVCGIMAVCGCVHAGMAHVAPAMDTLLPESAAKPTSPSF